MGLPVLVAALALAAASPLSALLPDATRVEAWRATAPASEYDPSTLSHFIDGGAEVYLDYGFVRAITAEYANSDDTITCAIYEMADSRAAYGVFSYFRTGQKAALTIGDAAFGADLQIAFWQDRYFVTVETFPTGAPRHDSLVAFARAISSRIPTHATLPSVVGRLPTGRAAGSEKLLRGRLAANALYTAWPSTALTFDDGTPLLTARYAPAGATLWLVPFRDRASLDAAWQLAASKLRPDAGCDPVRRANEDIVCVRDGRTAVARRVGSLLAIVSGAESLERATALLDQVQP